MRTRECLLGLCLSNDLRVLLVEVVFVVVVLFIPSRTDLRGCPTTLRADGLGKRIDLSLPDFVLSLERVQLLGELNGSFLR